MGFTTGLLGGITLTSAIAWLSISAHQRNRIVQGHLLRQQTFLLSTVVDADAAARQGSTSLSQAPYLNPTLPQSTIDYHTPPAAGILDMAKERWNREVEQGVRWMHAVDWTHVADRAEQAAVKLWKRVLG